MINIPERKLWNGKHYEIDYDKKVVKISEEQRLRYNEMERKGYSGFKKVTGSVIGAVLGLNDYSTEFIQSVNMMKLGMPIFDDKFTNAGTVIEPKIIQALNSQLKKELKTYPGQVFNWDLFKEQEHVGGLPDAWDPETRTLYELKTAQSKNGVTKEKWDCGQIPKYYQLQAALYGYLIGAERVKIVGVFLEPWDYDNLNDVNVFERNIKSYDVVIQKEKIEQAIHMAGNFRKEVKNTGESFKWNPTNKNDLELLSYLECKNQEEYDKWLLLKGYKK